MPTHGSLWLSTPHHARNRCLGEAGARLRTGANLGSVHHRSDPGDHLGRAVSGLRSALPDEIFRIPPSIPTLAEQFKVGGYETAGFVTALNTAKSYGYRRGFPDLR